MKKRYLLLTLSGVLVVTAPALALFGPLPVVDVGPESKTWLSQLVQQIETQKDEYESLKISIQNVTPTRFGWPASFSGVMSIEPLLQGATQTLNSYKNIVNKQSGVPMAPDAATDAAESGMDQLAGERADLANAQMASDTAPGDLAAQQAGQRINAMQVSDDAKLRQFMYAQQLQKSSDEADAEAWMTMPANISTDEL